MRTRKPVGLTAGLVLTVAACSSSVNPGPPGQQWWSDVQHLASDDMQGRLTGSEGHRKAVEYVVDQFTQLGAQPAGTQGFLQPIEFESRRLLEDRSSLQLSRPGHTMPLRFGTEVIAFPEGQSGQPFEAEMIFTGYGLRVPEYGYDDFAGLDVRGKVVVTLGGAPPGVPGTVAAHYSSLDVRIANLDRLGAVGSISIMNPRLEEVPWARVSAMRSQFTTIMDLADRDVSIYGNGRKVAAVVNSEHAATVLGITAERMAELLELDRSRKPLPKFAIPGRLSGTITDERSRLISDNVVAVVPGRDPALRSEYVLLSAHLDHVGVGDPINGDAIYNGAMDNASGVATLIDVARRLRAGELPRRSVILLVCTGEEMGLLGSRYFAKRPTVPIAGIVANINLDMFLPIIPLRVVRGYGVGESDLAGQLAAAAKEIGIAVQDDPEPERNIFIRSDQYSFIKEGVPSLFLSVGWEPGSTQDPIMGKWFAERYHAPSDDLGQMVDLESAERFNDLMTRLTRAIGNSDQKPRWKDASFFRTFANAEARSAPR